MKILNVAMLAAVGIVASVLGITQLQNKPIVHPVVKEEASKPVAPRASIPGVSAENVYLEDGVQVIEIKAKGGYTPAVTVAKAYKATILRMVTDDTFDCSSSVIIPDLKLRKRLPLSGSTDIQLPTIPENISITVYCGMGMYSFNLNFVS